MAERTIDLTKLHPGALEGLLHWARGRECEYAPGDETASEMRAAIAAELDEKYARIEAEVPGWKR